MGCALTYINFGVTISENQKLISGQPLAVHLWRLLLQLPATNAVAENISQPIRGWTYSEFTQGILFILNLYNKMIKYIKFIVYEMCSIHLLFLKSYSFIELKMKLFDNDIDTKL